MSRVLRLVVAVIAVALLASAVRGAPSFNSAGSMHSYAYDLTVNSALGRDVSPYLTRQRLNEPSTTQYSGDPRDVSVFDRFRCCRRRSCPPEIMDPASQWRSPDLPCTAQACRCRTANRRGL